MWEYIQESEFWLNIFWLAVASVVLPYLILVCFAGFGDGAKTGCLTLVFMYFGAAFVLTLILDAKYGFNSIETKDRGFKVISIFEKERAVLYEYYQELKARHSKCNKYIASLKQQQGELSSKDAKDGVDKEISKVTEEMKELEKMQLSIEKLAGRVYFARMMENLEINTDNSDLNEAAEIMEAQMKQALEEK